MIYNGIPYEYLEQKVIQKSSKFLYQGDCLQKNFVSAHRTVKALTFLSGLLKVLQCGLTGLYD